MQDIGRQMNVEYASLHASSGMQRRVYKRYSKYRTYLGLIAYVIQDSPNKMLTFTQLMEKVETFVSGDRKGLENNIRVCLSSNDCFTKVPVNPECPNAKRNFWKVDESRVTSKMVRRHFGGMLDMFPALSSKPEHLGCMQGSHTADALASQCSKLKNKHAVKFSGPFSIESLLKKSGSKHVSQTPRAMAGMCGVLTVGGQKHLHDQSYGALKRKTSEHLLYGPAESQVTIYKDAHSHRGDQLCTNAAYSPRGATSGGNILRDLGSPRKMLRLSPEPHHLFPPQTAYEPSAFSTHVSNAAFTTRVYDPRCFRW